MERLARDGRLIQAIAVSKAMPERDPGHVEAQAALASLYARRGGAPAPRPPPERPAPPGPVAEPATGFARIVLAAADAAAATADVDLGVEPEEGAAPTGAATPAQLPAFPIFSDLTPEAFLALVRAMTLRRVAAGEVVISEGGADASFYVVASGRLAVSKRDDGGGEVVVARLGEGDFFGEMALLSGAPRTATVTAEEAAELLEFPAEALLGVARAHPQLAASLRRFYRRRLLANALATSPIFRPFPSEERARIVERFRGREIRDGDKVIREGDPSGGLYVVLDGALDVVKRKGAAEVVVGRLHAGDVFGEISCLRKVPATASVVSRRAGAILELPRSAFDELVIAYPQILELVASLSEERSDSLDAILADRARWTEDGLVLL